MRENIIQVRTFKFAIEIVNLYVELTKNKEYVLSKQLLRSGTSIGANVEEAIAGQSKKDFLAKMSISLKEARETNYWLRLLKASNITSIDIDSKLNESNEIIKIISSIVKSTRRNL